MKKSDMKKFGSQQAKRISRINWLIRIVSCLLIVGVGFAAYTKLLPVYEKYKEERIKIAAKQAEDAQDMKAKGQKENAEPAEQTKGNASEITSEPADTTEPSDEAAVMKDPAITEPPAVTEPLVPPVSMNSVSISATSALSEYDMTHSPDRAVDGDIATAWVEGKEGQGEGEALVFTFPEKYLVSGFTINAGYQKNDDLYYKNSRPAVIRLSYSDGRSEEYTLEDINGAQTFNLNEPVATNSITLTIVSVFGGWKYEDTVISEVAFY